MNLSKNMYSDVEVVGEIIDCDCRGGRGGRIELDGNNGSTLPLPMNATVQVRGRLRTGAK